MAKETTPPLQSPASSLYMTVMLTLSVVLGVGTSVAAGLYANHHSRAMITQRAVDAATALSPNAVDSLSATAADLQTPAYQQTKDVLMRLSRNGPDIHAAYLLGEDKAGMYVYANSEPITSPNYAAPGQRLDDVAYALRSLDDTRQPLTAISDRGEDGVLLSAVAPVIDSTNGNYLGALGISIPASQHYTMIVVAVLTPLLLVALPVIALVHTRRVHKRESEIMKLKNHFVAVASHELRSPLSGILWAVQSLLKPSVKNLTIEQQVILLDMYQSAEESLTTINEILDLSAFERAEPKNNAKERIEISSIVKKATKTLRLSANERGIKFTFIGKWDDEKAYIVGDPNALKRMFMNLVANAIKYGRDETEITLRLSHKDGQYLIAIEDHGIGIPEADQKRVLEGYYRAKNAQETQRAGTGIGLLLAKLVAEQHGGKLWLTSKEGRGTTVYVSLPDADHAPVTTQSLPPRRRVG